MNKPSNNCNSGEWYPDNKQTVNIDDRQVDVWGSPVKPKEFDNLQYTPGSGQKYNKTILMDAYFTDKFGNETSVMYNVHSLYGTLETMATQKYLKKRMALKLI